MLNRQLANFLTQKWDAILRRLRLLKFKFLGVRFLGDVNIKKIKIPRNFHDIEIGDNTTIDDGSALIISGEPNQEPKIKIGKSCYFNMNTIIDASLKIEIKDNVMIGPSCYITDHDHGTSKQGLIMNQELIEEQTIISEGAWLGAHVKVLKGVVIGKGAIIGAGSVVTRDVEAYSISVGCPAKVIGKRK